MLANGHAQAVLDRMAPMIRRALNSSSDLPTTAAEYRADKTRMSRFNRRRTIGPLVLLFIIAIILNRDALLGLGRLTLCDMNATTFRTFMHSKGPLLDFFANVATTQRPHQLQSLSTLVMVAGHAIYTGSEWTPTALRDENHWILEQFQHGQVPTFLRHIEQGALLAANDTSALLLFSGGQTRSGSGPRSEGSTYWLAADAHAWFGRPEVRERAMAEEYARDSLENLLFSVCRFKQISGNYPRKIQVVSFGFKELRFVEVHRKSLRYPREQFEFIGIDPPGAQRSKMLTARERQFSMGPFTGDPQGCNNKVLRTKKVDRNPYLRFFPYPQGCPELEGLFRHCGRNVYEGALPWDDSSSEK